MRPATGRGGAGEPGAPDGADPAPPAGAVEPVARLRSRARRAGEVVLQVENAVARGLPADAALSALFRSDPSCGSRDRRFYGDIAFAAFRWRGWAGSVSDEGVRAMIWAHLLEATDTHPAIGQAARDQGLSDSSPVGGATLRAKAERFASRRGLDAPPDILALAPAWLPAEFEAGAERVDDRPETLLRFVESAQERPPLWLRADGVSGAELVARLKAAGVRATVSPALPRAVCVDGHPHLGELERRIGPVFSVQDLASQAVGAVCEAAPGESWWDVCAGAGGKSLDLAGRVGGGGRVLSTDVRASALRELERRGRRAGVPIEVARRDGRRPRPGAFDGVLVDAPCSGVGTWGRSPDARWRASPEAVARASRVQSELLAQASAAVRPGGRLIYAVCTLTRRETTDVASRFLEERPDFRPARQIHPITGEAAADGRLWLWPWHGPCGGMFVAAFSHLAAGGGAS